MVWTKENTVVIISKWQSIYHRNQSWNESVNTDNLIYKSSTSIHVPTVHITCRRFQEVVSYIFCVCLGEGKAGGGCALTLYFFPWIECFIEWELIRLFRQSVVIGATNLFAAGRMVGGTPHFLCFSSFFVSTLRFLKKRNTVIDFEKWGGRL